MRPKIAGATGIANTDFNRMLAFCRAERGSQLAGWIHFWVAHGVFYDNAICG
jgi:hypothetical protein